MQPGVPFPFSPTSPLWFCLATVLKRWQNGPAVPRGGLSVMCREMQCKLVCIDVVAGECFHLRDSLDAQLRGCSFQVYSNKQGYITCRRLSRSETCCCKNAVRVLNEVLRLLFSPDTRRSLRRICIRQKITASVLSGSPQVEVLHLACADGGGGSNAKWRLSSALITPDNGDNGPDDRR